MARNNPGDALKLVLCLLGFAVYGLLWFIYGDERKALELTPPVVLAIIAGWILWSAITT